MNSYKDIRNKIKILKEQKNTNYINILKDMLSCKKNYKASFEDYFLFDMFELNHTERKNILTKGINKNYILKFNDPKYTQIFLGKEQLYKNFSKYLNREWLKINGKNKKEFAAFCEKYKLITVSSNRNKEDNKIVDTSEYKLKDLYEELLEEGKVIIEETIDSHPDLKKMNETNTPKISVTTFLGRIIFSYIIIKEKNIYYFSPIDIDKGTIFSPMINFQKDEVELNYFNKKNKLITKIPLWKEITKIAEEICLEIPRIGYANWTFEISKNKIYLLNATANPDHEYYMYPAIKTEVLIKLNEIEEGKIEK